MLLSVSEVAEKFDVTKNAIYQAIRKNHLPANFYQKKWIIDANDLEKYYQERYKRKSFDKSKGELSVIDCAKMLGKSIDCVYYALRKRHLKHFRRGCAYVIKLNDLKDYENKRSKVI
jgi:excisionase family DNA binding protein